MITEKIDNAVIEAKPHHACQHVALGAAGPFGWVIGCGALASSQHSTGGGHHNLLFPLVS